MLFELLIGILATLVGAGIIALLSKGRWKTLARPISRVLPNKIRPNLEGQRLVVFVSSGGTCRDPMAKAIAEHIIKETAPELRGIRFEARALFATPSKDKASHAAQMAVIKITGSDSLKAHKPRTITDADIANADLILAMSQDLLHKDSLPSDKTYLFKQFLGQSGDVDDPWPDGRDEETLARYAATAEEIKTALENGLDRLAAGVHLPYTPHT